MPDLDPRTYGKKKKRRRKRKPRDEFLSDPPAITSRGITQKKFVGLDVIVKGDRGSTGHSRRALTTEQVRRAGIPDRAAG